MLQYLFKIVPEETIDLLLLHNTSSSSTDAETTELPSSLPTVTPTTALLSASSTGERSHFSLEKIRPLTQVCQNTPIAPRPRKNNRSGSTRILTDTPEKLKIDEENKKKLEKEKRRKKEKNECDEDYENPMPNHTRAGLVKRRKVTNL
ncbi:Uncharacterized protein APZ42_007255 [Daphnia magna]|uniref:Uncharacterized protein n=1 Tax=Daphnia magna TaxID=35525 RepID=A0A164FEG5_9CRUS|nr:Uncharacterized protein APZ42_007255 [Daphnia magna]